MLRGLRLQLARRLQVGDEREVDEARVVVALLEAELPRRLQERQRLDVARDAADLAEDDVAVMLAGGLDGVLDLVRDVRHHLHRTSQVAARAFPRKNRRVDAPRRVVRRLRAGHPREALVVAEIEVRLRPVVRHEHLAVLVRAHRARIDVQVWIELLHEHLVPPALQEQRQGRARDALAEGTHHAAGDEDVFRRILRLFFHYMIK